LNYGKHIHDFSSSEQEGETGESESGQAGKSYEYMFDRMHTNHGLNPVQYFKVLKEESESIHPYRSLNTNFDWEFLGPTNLTKGTQHHQGRIDCFATTSSNPGVICFAGSPTSGIWRTTDSGANWSNVTDNDIPMNIYNNLGQLIDQIDLSKDNGIHYLNARNWQSGLYILDLFVNGKVVESKSIVVKH
jgi:hypothetical protein